MRGLQPPAVLTPAARGPIVADPAARGRDFYLLMLCIVEHRAFLLLRRVVLWHVRRATDCTFAERAAGSAPGGAAVRTAGARRR